MNIFNLNDFIGGWFIGDFEPSIFQISNIEIAVKYYKKGDYEKSHFHKMSEELTLIASGKVKMNSIEFKMGDIIQINKNESTDFLVLEDTITIVVKTPSSKNDKFFTNR